MNLPPTLPNLCRRTKSSNVQLRLYVYASLEFSIEFGISAIIASGERATPNASLLALQTIHRAQTIDVRMDDAVRRHRWQRLAPLKGELISLFPCINRIAV